MATSLKQNNVSSHLNEKIFTTSKNKNTKKLKLKIGDTSVVKIQALGTRNVGLSEIPNGYTIVVPKAKLGETVKIQIENISIKPKYATAKVLEVLQETNVTVPVKVDEILDIEIQKPGPQGSGLYSLTDKFPILVPPASKSFPIKVGDKVKVQVIRVKQNYAFAKLIDQNSEKSKANLLTSQNLNSELRMANNALKSLPVGNSFNIKLPVSAKSFANYTVIKLKNSLVFVKMSLGAQLGETVRIRIVKTTSQYSIAKITKISPISKSAKQYLVKNNVKRMVAAGMHFGEKAIRCHANMRKFIWIRKKGKNQNRPLMKRGRHIINILKTRSCLNQALEQLGKYAAKGKTFLFVGTKKSASSLIARTAMLTKTSYFVNTRWLGGMLTNWKTILKSISQIRPILKEKQKMIQKILEKRQKIKKRLLKKVNLLRKKSVSLLEKGKELLGKIKQDRNTFFTRSQQLLIKKNEILAKNELLIQKYSELKNQKQKILTQALLLEQKGNELINQKSTLIQQIEDSKQKLQEFKQLYLIGQEISKLKNELQNNGKTIWAVPFETIVDISKSNDAWIIPNPSTAVLNKMISAMKLKYQKNNLASTITLNEFNNRSKSTTQNTVIMSQLLNKVTDYLPFIEAYMKTLVLRIQTFQTISQKLHENIETIRQKLVSLNSSNVLSNLDANLNLIKNKLQIEQENIKLLKRKLKQLAAEQKLLKFLPKLRYLPTSKKKMLETVEFLMKKFVDPKMSYSMEQVYDQKLKFTSKKLAATRKQKWQRLEKYFGGIAKMAKMKRKQIANNVVIIVGQQEEMNAVRECKKLGMKMFTIVDTNCNPRLSDYIIPANDDSRNSIKFILGQMLTRIRLAQKLRKKILAKPSI